MRIIHYLAAALFVFSTSASATPCTFDFTTPPYSINLDHAIFGTAMRLTITVDNGNHSCANQKYQFSNIKSVYAKAVHGAFSVHASHGGPYTSFSNTVPFITTNNSGAPTFRISHQNMKSGGWQGGTKKPHSALIRIVSESKMMMTGGTLLFEFSDQPQSGNGPYADIFWYNVCKTNSKCDKENLYTLSGSIER